MSVIVPIAKLCIVPLKSMAKPPGCAVAVSLPSDP
jgi:hypothetical protein